MKCSMSDDEYVTSKVRLDMVVEVTHERTDVDAVIEETAKAKYGHGVILGADIVEDDTDSG